MLRIAFRNFITTCRTHVAFFLLSFFCLISVFVCLLFIQQRNYFSYKEHLSTQQSVLYFSCENPAIVQQIAAEINDTPALPKAAVISVYGGQYCGLYWDRNQRENVWYTPYGRFFTTDEMEGGAKVAILGTGYIGQLPFEEMDSLWESGIEIGGVPYKVVGNYFFYWETADVPEEDSMAEPLCAPIVIPLKTFWDGGFSASRFRCEFAAPVTAEQRALLANLLQPHAEIRSLSLPDVGNGRAFAAYVGGSTSSTLIVLMALISLVNIILYWLKNEFERYRIYRICGARRGQILRLLLLQILFLITLAYLCAYGIARMLIGLMPAGFVLPLPGTLYAGIYLASLLFIGAVAVIKAYPRILRGRILDQ